MITLNQQETFQSQGLIRLDGFLPADKVNGARDVVLEVLEKRGIWRDGAWCLDELPPSTSPAAGASLIKGRITRSRALGELMTADLLDAITALLGGRPVSPMTATPPVLFTLPNAPNWTVPHLFWHLDVPRLPDGELPGVQMFSFLDKVAPGGGGTLVVAGSHRLLNHGKRISSKQVKRLLKREPYFRDLMSDQDSDRTRFLREAGRVGDVPLQVVELHGDPGDVYLVDMRMLHTLAPNAARAPRIMVTQRFLPAGSTAFSPGTKWTN